MDFIKICERSKKNGIEIYPEFQVRKTKDLMVRGKEFYAVWDAEAGLWSRDEYDVRRLVDEELWKYNDEMKEKRDYDGNVKVMTMSDFSTRSWSEFRKYVTNISDNNHTLDEQLTFADTKVKKTDYVSHRLPYSLSDDDCPAWRELSSTLYEPEELAKIEWMIGAIVSGDSREIQKFAVFYGEAGTGKSTIISIIQKLFEGYYTTFDAKALGSNNNQFSTDMFRSNPLVAIQHDGDLSRIEDNTKLNSIVAHEMMPMNEKYKSGYSAKTNCFLIMGTNKPVKITDSKSGIIRRLIDIHPSGRRIPPSRYKALMTQIGFELGAIAKRCLDIYRKMGRDYYETYRPYQMILQTDVFFNFVEYNYEKFVKMEGVSLNQAYEMYNEYCDKSAVPHKLPRYKFREELKDYYDRFMDITHVDGKSVRSYYRGFKKSKFINPETEETPPPPSLVLDREESLLDILLAECPAQYATEDEKPRRPWDDVKTQLKDLDSRKLHYIRPPVNHIVVDFDLKDESGNKSLERNLEAASNWPPTYAELSKGGQGIHLHYIYEGNVSRLSPIYKKDIEVKVFLGKASLRRRLSKCNGTEVATLRGGLPERKESNVIDFSAAKNDRGLKTAIENCLEKKHHGATKPEIDLICKLLEDAQKAGLRYDMRSLRPRVRAFALKSTNQSDYCMKRFAQMQWTNGLDDVDTGGAPKDSKNNTDDRPLIFFDVEVFTNLFLLNWKTENDARVHRMINPTGAEIEPLLKCKLVGFNCRRYDNHILYGRYIGMTNEELYKLSQNIVSGHSGAMFSEAYDLSYTDVYDFCSKKQSLKKWEIELGIHHQELGLPWDEPVDPSLWEKVAEYCDNDVIATEAVFHNRKADWTAREILADIADMNVNSTTNSLTTKIIFGSNRKPQNQFNYRFMGEVRDGETYLLTDIPGVDNNFTCFETDGKPVFPGYRFEAGKSTYRGEEVGEGGYVYAEPGIYHNVALLDIASMHPSSIVAENLFGDEYTARFRDILQTRIRIKHKDYDEARKMFDGKLAPYLEDEQNAKDLAQALKIAINSVYGLTSAKFDNPFHDVRNKDNIVAKRGALFMINLKHEVQNRGFTVAHIKTDSIKIPNATPEIIQFVMDYGKAYGYSFEHEATYDRMCLVNDAVYIAKYKDGDWTATGAQFQQPFVFKTLFSGEAVTFDDLCETKSVTGALYLDFNEDLPDVSQLEKALDKLRKNDPNDTDMIDRLETDISEGHAYQFVGRAGQFSPVKPGTGGGLLMREKDGKYYAVTGTKGYRWVESEKLRGSGMEKDVDIRYYLALQKDAIKTIQKYGSFRDFVEGDLSFNERWAPPCGDNRYPTCFDCEKYLSGECGLNYDLQSTIFDVR